MKSFILRILSGKLIILGPLFASIVLLLYSYTLPFMEVEKLIFFKSQYSLIHSLKIMWEEGFYFLAFIIFLFSMIFPLAKLIVLSMLYFFTFSNQNKRKIIHWLGVLGKWSMLDVFVVAIIIVLVKSQALVSARPCIGLYIFAVAIMVSMLVSFMVEKLITGAEK